MRFDSSSSCATRFAVCSGVNCWSSRIAGSGVLACRSSGVLPPPSRLACASASALSDRDWDLVLTSTTCSGCRKLAALRGSGITSAMPNSAKACSATERVIDADRRVFNALIMPSRLLQKHRTLVRTVSCRRFLLDGCDEARLHLQVEQIDFADG